MAGFGFRLGRQPDERGYGAIVGGARDRGGHGHHQLAHAVGVHSIALASVLSVTRFLGVVIAVGFTLWLLWHSAERGWVRSLGLALLLFVILGPVVQPGTSRGGSWCLAASYKGREHFWLLLLSIIGPFIGLPGGRQLLSGLVHSNPLLIALAVAILGGVLIAPMGSWTQWSWPEREPALGGGDVLDDHARADADGWKRPERSDGVGSRLSGRETSPRRASRTDTRRHRANARAYVRLQSRFRPG